METHERELYVARICSGSIRCVVEDKTFLIKKPSRDQLYVAQELYHEVLHESHLDGLFDEDSLYDFILQEGTWDEESEDLMKKLPKQIEEFKVGLYKNRMKASESKVIRKALGVARTKLEELSGQRHTYAHLSCSGAASIVRSRYVLACSIFTLGGVAVFSDDTLWEEDNVLLDRVMEVYMRSKLEEAQFRELARTEPWRSLWSARQAEKGVFGVSVVDLTEEQKSLVCWSSLYDNILQHPSSPPEEVVKDDDMLDGWMIQQRKERDKGSDKQWADDLLQNEKIRNADEVYLVAENPEQATKIDGLNDEHAAAVKRQRFAALREKGVMNELEMPDTRRRLLSEIGKRLSQTP